MRSVGLLVFFLCLSAMVGCVNRPPKNPVSVRVMSYNIHHGRGMDGEVDLERIARVITAENPDIVALQEVDRGVERTGRRDLPGELAALTGMRAFFERNITYQGGDYGNAVLTRLPVLEEENIHLRMIREGEQRGVIRMVLAVGGKPIVFMNTHIDHRLGDDEERLLNVEQFKEIAASSGYLPIIIVGDFNDWPDSRTHRKMKEMFIDAWEVAGNGEGFTYRSDLPDRRIDYVWFAGEIEAVKAWIPQSLASDHLPLVADLEVIID